MPAGGPAAPQAGKYQGYMAHQAPGAPRLPPGEPHRRSGCMGGCGGARCWSLRSACGIGDWWPPEGFCWSNTRPRRGKSGSKIQECGSALSGKHCPNDKALMKAPADEPPSCCRVRCEQRLRRRCGYVRRLQPRRREGRQGGARARAACRAATGAAAWPGARD